MHPAVRFLILGAGLLLVMRASARPVSIDESTGLPDVDLTEGDAATVVDDAPSEYDYGELNADPWEPVMSSDPDQQLQSFLYMIRASEHAFPRDVVSGRAYSTFYGGAQFSDFSDHPVLTGELRGVPLPAQWCINAGYPDGKCVSTAAGAYQINVPTWREVRSYGGPTLPDFSPESQDEAARRILLKIGALAALTNNRVTEAIRIASKRWASLPGSTAGQGGRSMAFVLARLNEGPTLA